MALFGVFLLVLASIGHGQSSSYTYAGKLNIPMLNFQLSRPRQTVVAENFIFVLDTKHSRLAIADRETLALTYFGGHGDDDGKFRKPEGLALDPRPGYHRLAVADTNRNRVQLFTFDPVSGSLSWDRSFGIGGAGDGQFAKPRGIAIMDGSGDIYVADTENNRIQVFASDGEFLRSFQSYGNYAMSQPQGVAVDPATGVFVADTGNHQVLHFTDEGDLVARFGAYGVAAGQFREPVDIRVWHYPEPPETGGGTIIFLCVTDRLNNRVQIFSQSGEHRLNVGNFGSYNGQFHIPHGAFPLPGEERLFVADAGNQRVQWFDVVLDTEEPGEMPPFQIVALGGQPAMIVWEAEIDAIYRVEKSYDLAAVPVVWHEVDAGIVANSSPMSLPISMNQPMEFYRVIRTQ